MNDTKWSKIEALEAHGAYLKREIMDLEQKLQWHRGDEILQGVGIYAVQFTNGDYTILNITKDAWEGTIEASYFNVLDDDKKLKQIKRWLKLPV